MGTSELTCLVSKSSSGAQVVISLVNVLPDLLQTCSTVEQMKTRFAFFLKKWNSPLVPIGTFAMVQLDRICCERILRKIVMPE